MNSRSQTGRTLALLTCLAMPSGCYNASALVESHRATALLTKLEEVDLGKFRVTLPYETGRSSSAEVQFHAFGQVKNKDLSAVRDAIEEHQAEIMHELLLSVRHLPVNELEDPRLNALRESIREVVNATLEDEPVRMVGFYDFYIAQN